VRGTPRDPRSSDSAGGTKENQSISSGRELGRFSAGPYGICVLTDVIPPSIFIIQVLMRTILKHHWNIIAFGILEIFFSAPGQTFLISFFVAKIFQDLPVSLSAFAGIYSAATLAASLLLNPAGQIIDRYPVRKVATGVSLLMALGCWELAFSTNLIGIFIAFFILRLIGQGVLGLTATTLVIKKFFLNRGKALSLIMLGYPLSEMIYPFVCLYFLELAGWRWTYIWLGLSNVVILLPLQLIGFYS
jgi:MFS family permease